MTVVADVANYWEKWRFLNRWVNEINFVRKLVCQTGSILIQISGISRKFVYCLSGKANPDKFQGRRKQLRIGIWERRADRAALRAPIKFLLINIHEERVFHTFTRIKMAVRQVFAVSVAAVHSDFTVSSKVLQLYLYCSLGCSVVSLKLEI